MYSPKVKEELVRELYKYKKRYPINKPMTFFVNEAVQDYLQKNGVSDATNKRMVLGPQKKRTNFTNRPIKSNQGG